MSKLTITGITMLSIDIILALLLFFLCGGLPESKDGDVNTFMLQMVLTAATLVVIPVGLKYISTTRIHGAKTYHSLCLIRFVVYELLILANLIVAYVLSIPSCFYLACLMWVATIFAFPGKVKPKEEPVKEDDNTEATQL